MPIKTETRTLGNTQYQVSTLTFSKQRAMLVFLANAAGPLLSKFIVQLASAAQGSKTQDDATKKVMAALGSMKVDAFGSIAGEFLASLTDAKLQYLQNEFVGVTDFFPSGEKGFRQLKLEDMELHFQGDGLLEYFRWLAFALEVNFSGFFTGPSGLSALAQNFVKKETKSD